MLNGLVFVVESPPAGGQRCPRAVVSVVVVVVVFSPKCCQNVCWKREKIKQRVVHRKCVSRLENI
jgi:hypothetical protein